MRNPFLACAAVVLTAAALAACGSSADGNDPEAAGAQRPAASGPAAPGPSATTATEPATPPTEEPADPEASAPAATAEGPKTPADEITPATGTFTKKQKEYLKDRVPKGMDPAAVLQTGQETCDKLRYLVKGDRDTAVGAIVTGEVPDAKDAVAGLCTQHQDLVDEAAYGYPDGKHTGKKLRPGVYRSASPPGTAPGRSQGRAARTWPPAPPTPGSRKITIPESAVTFTSTGCYAWLPEGAAG